MSIFQKVIFSFLLSILFFGTFSALSYSGIIVLTGLESFSRTEEILVFSLVFLLMYFCIFFFMNIRIKRTENYPRKKKIRVLTENNIRESEEPSEVPIIAIEDEFEEVPCAEEIPNTNNSKGPGGSLFITDKNYLAITGSNKIEVLDTIDSGGSAIEERNGVHYVKAELLNKNIRQKGSINKDFKDLVDSIIKY